MYYSRKAERKLVASLMVIAMLFSAVAFPASAFSPEDIEGHWAQERIQSWLDQGLASGYPDGTFQPDEEVSRAEFVAFMDRAFEVPDALQPPGFEDVHENEWHYDHVAAAVEEGLLTGYPDNTFRPDNPIIREEAAAIVNRLVDLEGLPPPGDFADQDDISGWAEEAVDAIVAAEIMTGYPDDTFRPGSSITRAETVSTLDRALEYELPPEAFSVTFYVQDVEEEALGDAYVELNGYTETTDAQGEAVFEDVERGSYNYTISKEGYPSVEDEINVGKDLIIEVELAETLTVENAEELYAALEAENVGEIVFAGDIEADITVDRTLVIDFDDYTLDGDMEFNHDEEGTSRLLGTADPSIDGDLIVNTPNASFINNVTVSGEIEILAVKHGSYTENTDGNSIIISAVDASISIVGTPYSISVSAEADGISLIVETEAELEIDVDGNARNITVDAAEGANVSLSGDGAVDVAVEGEGEVETVAIEKLEDELLRAALVEMNGNTEEIHIVGSYLEGYYDIDKQFDADHDDLTWAEAFIRVGEDAYKDLLHITADGDDGDDIARLVTADGEKLDPFQIHRDLLANFVFLNIDYSAAGDYFPGSSLPTTHTVYDFFDVYSLTATPNAILGWKGEISYEAREAFAERFYYWALEKGESVYVAAQEAQFEIENDYPDMPEWDINYANGFFPGDVFLKPRIEEYGAVIGYMISYCAETGDLGEVLSGGKIELEEIVVEYRSPETGEYRAIYEEDLENYRITVIRENDGVVVYELERDDIQLEPKDGYSLLKTDLIPTKKFLEAGYYELRLEMVCDQGHTQDSTRHTVFCKEQLSLTVCAGEGGVVTADILPEDNIIEDCRTITVCKGFAVDLEAHPQPDWDFQEWQGDATGDEAVIQVMMDSDKEIKAQFSPAVVDLVIPQSPQILEIEEGEEVGESFQFTAEAEYGDGEGKVVTGEAQWTSSEPDVATVDDGEVTARSEGTATIYAELDGEETTTSVKVELVDPTIEELYIPEGSQTLQIADTFQFTAEVEYADGSKVDVTEEAEWTSSDPTVATVGNGLVHALDEGSTTIYADYKGEEAAASVTVKSLLDR